MKILSTKQFYKADSITIKKENIRSVELMERAAEQCFNWLHSKMGGAQVPIHIFCGIGNNGGDGLAMGRLLINHGYNVIIYIANFTDKRSKDFLINYNLVKEVNKKWPILMASEDDFPVIDKDDIIVDALFGIGLNRPPKGWVKKLIQFLNNNKAFKLAIDIPSGLYPNKALKDTEAVLKANHTLSFQAPKLAFFLPETAKFTLSFNVLDIGLDSTYLAKIKPLAQTFGKLEAQKWYRPRNRFDHKGTYGHCLLIGGSYGKIGAITLASKAALKIGAGLVTAFVPECGVAILQTTFPEAMVLSDASEKYIKTINIAFEPSAIGVGVGLGTKIETITALKNLFTNSKAPMVIDADALNCISESKELLKVIPKNSILTPHHGELKRLIGEWTDDFNKIELAKEFSEKHAIIFVIKGAYSLVINGDDLYINTSGNPGMATAGSGDVLTGIITGLLSQGYKTLEATLFGVYLHGIAGDIASRSLSFEAVIASDIIKNIGNAYLDLFKKETKKRAKTNEEE